MLLLLLEPWLTNAYKDCSRCSIGSVDREAIGNGNGNFAFAAKDDDNNPFVTIPSAETSIAGVGSGVGDGSGIGICLVSGDVVDGTFLCNDGSCDEGPL